MAVSRSPTFGLRSSYAIGPERHVIAEGYMTLKLNCCLKPTLTLILTLRPSRRVFCPYAIACFAFESFCAPVFFDFTRNFFPSDSATFGHLAASFNWEFV